MTGFNIDLGTDIQLGDQLIFYARISGANDGPDSFFLIPSAGTRSHRWRRHSRPDRRVFCVARTRPVAAQSSRRLRRLSRRFFFWGDVPVFRRRPFVIRRIDVLTAALFVICTGYYGWIAGWLGALAGGLMFIFIAMTALWFF